MVVLYKIRENQFVKIGCIVRVSFYFILSTYFLIYVIIIATLF